MQVIYIGDNPITNPFYHFNYQYEGILMLCESKIQGESNGVTSHKPGNESVFSVLKTLYLHG